MTYISTSDPLAIDAVAAIQSGDVERLKRLLRENPSLAGIHVRDAKTACGDESSRTMLHVATDWPGHFPNAAETVAVLVAAGADVNASFEGRHAETPLHWAASSDDVAALDALLNHGADIEAPGAVIGDGTPLADAAAFGQWKVARRLVERGARTTLWQAAALGLTDRVQGHFDGKPLLRWPLNSAPPGSSLPDEITHAFWSACHGGKRPTAEFLLSRGADINWIGYDHLTPLGAAQRTGAAELVEWLFDRGAKTTSELR